MADITVVARKLSSEDFTPNYDFQIQGIAIDEEESARQKQYLQMFLKENFEVLESQTSGMNVEQINAYLKGAKDAIAFVNLWIDSLNTLELPTQDITE